MEEENKTGFLWQYVIACFFPAQYGKLLKKKKSSFAGYIIVLILFLSLIEYVIPFAAWDVSVGGLENLFLNRLPAFTLENGEYSADSPVSFTVGGVLHVEADSAKDEYTKDDLDSDYVQEILIGKTNMYIKTTSGSQSVKLSQLGSMEITNETLAEMLPALYVFMAVYLLILILIKAAEYLLIAFGFALICRSSVRSQDGKMVSLSEAFYISVYAKTLFGLINSANAALGYLVNSTVMIIIAVFVTMGLIVRAEQSVLKPELSS